MGTSVNNIGNGGGQPKGVRDVFQGGGTGGTDFWGGDIGDDPLNGTGPGGVQTNGSTTDHC